MIMKSTFIGIFEAKQPIDFDPVIFLSSDAVNVNTVMSTNLVAFLLLTKYRQVSDDNMTTC